MLRVHVWWFRNRKMRMSMSMGTCMSAPEYGAACAWLLLFYNTSSHNSGPTCFTHHFTAWLTAQCNSYTYTHTHHTRVYRYERSVSLFVSVVSSISHHVIHCLLLAKESAMLCRVVCVCMAADMFVRRLSIVISICEGEGEDEDEGEGEGMVVSNTDVRLSALTVLSAAIAVVIHLTRSTVLTWIVTTRTCSIRTSTIIIVTTIIIIIVGWRSAVGLTTIMCTQTCESCWCLR